VHPGFLLGFLRVSVTGGRVSKCNAAGLAPPERAAERASAVAEQAAAGAQDTRPQRAPGGAARLDDRQPVAEEGLHQRDDARDEEQGAYDCAADWGQVCLQRQASRA